MRWSSLAGHRREALWETLAVDEPTRLDMPARCRPSCRMLVAPTEGEEIVGDYAAGRPHAAPPSARAAARAADEAPHPHAPRRSPQARNGQFIRTAGIVTCRQRPATASGVIFVTLEDETGYVNLIVWNDLADRQRRELLGSRLLAVHGEVQREGLVVHILARRLDGPLPIARTPRNLKPRLPLISWTVEAGTAT